MNPVVIDTNCLLQKNSRRDINDDVLGGFRSKSVTYRPPLAAETESPVVFLAGDVFNLYLNI